MANYNSIEKIISAEIIRTNEDNLLANTICNTAMHITQEGELCVRAGGDEFYVIGIGQYTPAEADRRIAAFYQELASINANLNKPYDLSASIGSACTTASL